MQKQTQRRKMTFVLSALLIIVVGLALYFVFKTSATSTKPWTMEHKNFQLHEYDGENLVSLDESPPIDKSNKVLFNGKTYELKLSFDRPYISPIPGSEITGRIEIFEDGRKMKKLPEDFAISQGWSREWMLSLKRKDIEESGPIFAVSLNSWTLMNSISGIERVMVDNSRMKMDEFDYNFSWFEAEGSYIEKGQEIWYNQKGWSTPDFGVNRYHINSSFSHIYSPDLFDKAGRRLALASDIWLDISDGDAEFTFVYDGTRAQPFLNFEVAFKNTQTSNNTTDSTGLNDERGNLGITRSVFFEDQFKNPVDISNIDKVNKTSFYYDVQTSESQLTPNESQTITLDITSRNKNGSLNDNPYQRVQIRTNLAESSFKVDGIVSARRGRTQENGPPYTKIIGAIMPRHSGSPNEPLAFTGTIFRTSYGQFDGYKNESQFVDDNENIDTNPIGDVFNFNEIVLEFRKIFGELEDSGKNPDVIDSIDKLKAQLQLYPTSEEETLKIIEEWKDKTKKYIEDADVDVPDYLNLEPNQLLELINSGKVSLTESDLFSEFTETTTFGDIVGKLDEPQFINPNLITVPLVNGKASVTYTYNGLTGHQLMVTFHVSPIDSYVGLRGCSRSLNAVTSVCIDNIQIALENLPTRPDGLEVDHLTKVSSVNDFILYEEWLEPSSPKLGAYTIVSIPIGKQAASQLIDQSSKFIPQLVLGTTNKIPNHLLWLITLQLAQILFGGLWLIFKYSYGKQKTK